MTRLPASPQTSSLASASEHLLPPLSERWAPYLRLVRTAPLTPGSVDELIQVSMLLSVCEDGWCPSCWSSECLVTFSTHASLSSQPCLHTSNPSDSAGCQNTSTTPVGDWMNGLLPAVQAVQTVLNNRTNRSQSVWPSLVFQDQGQHQAENEILNTDYPLRKLSPNPTTCQPSL